MILSLDNWIGLVVGALRRHHISFDEAPLQLHPRKQHVHGRAVKRGDYTIALGDRRSVDGVREAFFEIRSAKVGLLLRITHRILVRRGGQKIPRMWFVDATLGIRARLHITRGEVREQGLTLDIIDRVADHLFTAA